MSDDTDALQNQSPSPPLSPTGDTDGSNTRGIDIKAALSLLSSRANAGGEKELRQDVPNKVAEERRSMGQSIDAFQWARVAEDCDCGKNVADGTRGASVENWSKGDDGADEAEAVKAQRKALDEQRKKNEAELRSKLEKMNISELLGAIFEAQKERTIAYREYNRGLDTVLSTGNITNYPSVVASATASFSVLSDTINAIKRVLFEKHGRKDLAKLIRDLQQSEKEKLNTTAALHLERIREKNEAIGIDGSENDRIHSLLRNGVITLRSKIAEVIEAINETLEELRYAAVEEE